MASEDNINYFYNSIASSGLDNSIDVNDVANITRDTQLISAFEEILFRNKEGHPLDAVNSCQRCRKLKKKCTKHKPKCLNCFKTNYECIYVEKTKDGRIVTSTSGNKYVNKLAPSQTIINDTISHVGNLGDLGPVVQRNHNRGILTNMTIPQGTYPKRTGLKDSTLGDNISIEPVHRSFEDGVQTFRTSRSNPIAKSPTQRGMTNGMGVMKGDISSAIRSVNSTIFSPSMSYKPEFSPALGAAPRQHIAHPFMVSPQPPLQNQHHQQKIIYQQQHQQQQQRQHYQQQKPPQLAPNVGRSMGSAAIGQPPPIVLQANQQAVDSSQGPASFYAYPYGDVVIDCFPSPFEIFHKKKQDSLTKDYPGNDGLHDDGSESDYGEDRGLEDFEAEEEVGEYFSKPGEHEHIDPFLFDSIST
ncbi:hypothetical protein DASC09_029950 [Saccharomycopsis crataegensis]|uniref:Zn(2)-C6 fungal-type domain-containing protein n=1 Tax=Saccharomycopsis crataegensis TaxID=43959 RepID=A0AAV5QMA5_9ASCO|nr:hypothetical protein DASC09_029950 [Saccharomycopsis crataegensis]